MNFLEVLIRVVAHLLFVISMIFFVALTSNEYSWMKDVDPSITTLPVDDASGFKIIVTTLILALFIVMQLVIVVSAKNKWEKLLSITLILGTTAVWYTRF